MASEIAERRVQVATALRTLGSEGFPLQRNRLRFCLGASAADVKVPFHIGPGVDRILIQGARQLAFMLVLRHKQLLASEEIDQFMLRDELATLPRASEALLPDTGGPDIRSTAELGFSLHPLLTGGVMATWLRPGGGGRSLVALMIELMKRASAEMAQCRGREETPTLVALMLASALPRIDPAVRSAGLPPTIEREVRGAVAIGVLLALRLGLSLGLGREQVAPELLARVEAPFGLLTIISTLSRAGVGLAYGCELAVGVPGQEGALSAFEALGPEEATRQLARSVVTDDKAAARVEAAVVQAQLRAHLFAVLRASHAGGIPFELRHAAEELLVRPGRLAGLLADGEEERKSLARAFAGYEKRAGALAEDVGALATAFKRYSPRAPGDCLHLPHKVARQRYAEAATGYLAELWLEQKLRPWRQRFSLREGTEAEGGITAEYEKGRLYRISLDPGPLLKNALEAPIGHFFIDVKDFTRRTSLIGQTQMAEFLRSEFYQPILEAARAHYGGLSTLSDGGGIQLNNLLGDALSLSGQIDALVELAKQVRRRLEAYQRHLKSAVSSERVQQEIDAIEREFADRARRLPHLNPERLRQDKLAAIARAQGEELEAGIFISFGPAPLVIRVEDPVFGDSKVAIGERINESARGTARAAGARVRADALLAQAQERLGNPQLRHPFSVFIGQPFTMHLSPEIEAAARAAVQKRDVPGALKALLVPLKDALSELTDPPGDVAGDIYNSGAALSEEALLAFQEAQGHAREFRSLELDPERLHPHIRARYFFPPSPLRLVACFDKHRRLAELFRYVGRALFKGLERKGGVPVWELCAGDGLVPLLAEHHAPEWLRGR